ncbi:hypothetical protein FLL45_05075 [Aliikangiella marina]|uniref:Amino acid ABC transporter substrate-binding protein n=2 Tax=Aliikangiella marina TaxID=1712262 RepID=A0A545TJB3_9GAMM|nr:hypothetical protein FLL45_05075 [Aliikangiella marina]
MPWFNESYAFQERASFSVGYIHFPPLIIVDEPDKGPEQVKGLLSELMIKSVSECNFDVNFSYLSLNRFYAAVAKGDKSQVQIIPKGIKQLDGLLIYSDFPVAVTALNMYWNKSHATQKTYNLKDLSDQTVVVISGYQYAGLIQKLREYPKLEIISVDNVKAAKTLLLKGRAKFALIYQSMFEQEKAFKNSFAFTNLSTIEYFISAHKDLANKEEILACLADVHQRILNNKTVKKTKSSHPINR